jgi:hypothetical protein
MIVVKISGIIYNLLIYNNLPNKTGDKKWTLVIWQKIIYHFNLQND